jgi:hypothetical protein
MSTGVQRADRFAGDISAHYPLVASKYEPQPAPETSSPAPAAAGAPSFTFYPEGGAAGGPTTAAPAAANCSRPAASLEGGGIFLQK